MLRAASAAAVVVLAVLSRGDALVLAGLLALATWRPLGAVAIVAALAASSWRWGSSSLEALAGAQAVLGPAGLVGPIRSAAASWLAAVAILLAGSPRPGAWLRPADVDEEVDLRRHPQARRSGSLLLAAAVGATVAAVVAGPAVGGEIWVRVVATVAAAGLAFAAGPLVTGRVGLVVDAGAVLAGVGALTLVRLDGPGLSGVVDVPALRAGATIALAVAVLVAVGGRTALAMGNRRA